MSGSLCGHVFIYLRYISGNRAAGWYDRSMSEVTRNCQTVLQSGHVHSAFPPAADEFQWLHVVSTDVLFFTAAILVAV